MIPLSIKPIGVSLLIGLFIGIILTLLFKGCGRDSAGGTFPVVSPKQIIKEANSSEAEYREKVAVLEDHSQKLQQQLTEVQAELTLIKAKTKSRESTIKKLIEPKGYPAKALARKSPTSIDSSLSPCDSLASEVSEYIVDNIRKDSLYEIAAQKKDSIIAVKDSVILTTIKVHEDFKVLLDKSVKQQETLFTENKSLKKQIKRQKLRSTLKTIGLVILTGAAGFLSK